MKVEGERRNKGDERETVRRGEREIQREKIGEIK